MKSASLSVMCLVVFMSDGSDAVYSAPIGWSGGDFDSDSDVRNDGTTVSAYYFTGDTVSGTADGTSPLSGPITVNGVDWQSVFVAPPAEPTNQFPPSGFTTSPVIDAAAYGHTLATAGFGALIAGVAFETGPIDVTLTDLTPGNKYLVQWLYHHSGVQGRTTTLDDGLGNSITLTNSGITLTDELVDGSPVTGSWTDGEFATGIFVADAATQSFQVTASAGSVLVNGVQLRLVGQPGDVNGDGFVNAADFAVIRMNFLDEIFGVENGDLNEDGIVDFRDYREWKDNRDSGSSLGEVVVPEPNSAALLLAVVLTAIGGCRRFRR